MRSVARAFSETAEVLIGRFVDLGWALVMACVLSSALDAAVSARAKNSIEKMLCHQMAAAHMAGMELLGRVEQSPLLHKVPPRELG